VYAHVNKWIIKKLEKKKGKLLEFSIWRKVNHKRYLWILEVAPQGSTPENFTRQLSSVTYCLSTSLAELKTQSPFPWSCHSFKNLLSLWWCYRSRNSKPPLWELLVLWMSSRYIWNIHGYKLLFVFLLLTCLLLPESNYN
jgi:hypothetical protein